MNQGCGDSLEIRDLELLHSAPATTIQCNYITQKFGTMARRKTLISGTLTFQNTSIFCLVLPT